MLVLPIGAWRNAIKVCGLVPKKHTPLNEKPTRLRFDDRCLRSIVTTNRPFQTCHVPQSGALALLADH
jgi:hypothetical protein